MKTSFLSPLALSLLALVSCDAQDAPPADAPAVSGDPAALVSAATELAASGDAHGVRSAADPAWWFLRNELKHVAAGNFWDGESLAEGDPIAAISAYAKGLKELGVDLLLVPVPPKASIYPEKLAAGAGATPTAPFYAKLSEAGVEVLDIEPLLRAELSKTDAKLYCAQDSHWSPTTCQMVAKEIASRYGSADWVAGAKLGEITAGESTTVEIHGDLLDDAAKGSDAKESLQIVYAGSGGGAKPTPVEPNKSSPLMLLGDSHTLVFHSGGEMHTRGAGLADHLAAKFGFPVDLEASMGSGGDSARISVARRAASDKAMWGGKKLVVWCFSAREFTQGKWRELPVQP